MLTRPTCVIRFSMSTSVPLTSGTGDARDIIKEAKRTKMKSARRAIVCVTSKGTKLLAGRGQDTGSRTRNFKRRILGVFYTWSSAVTQSSYSKTHLIRREGGPVMGFPMGVRVAPGSTLG